MKRSQLLEMGAKPLSETEFYGYLVLEREGIREIYEPENVKDIDNCAYFPRNKFPLPSK